MSERRKVWLVGRDRDGVLHVVPAEAIDEAVNGLQTVNLRPGCGRSMLLESLPVEKVHATEVAAIAHVASCLAPDDTRLGRELGELAARDETVQRAGKRLDAVTRATIRRLSGQPMIFRKKGDKSRYDFRDERCIYAECWAPGVFQHRGATASGSRNTGSARACCLNRAYHGCPREVVHQIDLARARRAEGWRRA